MSNNISKYHLFLTGISITCFAGMLVIAKGAPVRNLDVAVTRWVQVHSSETLDILMLGVSKYGQVKHLLIFALGITAVLFYKKAKMESIYLSAIAVFIPLISYALKHLYFRPRPDPSLVRVLERNDSSSFPSGTTLSYVLLFGFILCMSSKTRRLNTIAKLLISTLCVLLILLSSLSRIYLGAHWFTDVSAGLFAGMVFLNIFCYFYQVGKSPLHRDGKVFYK